MHEKANPKDLSEPSVYAILQSRTGKYMQPEIVETTFSDI